MEKGTPHCPLATVKALVAANKVRATGTALRGAAALGLDFHAMLAVVLALQIKDFYKSMTTYADHRIWQDVYKTAIPAGEV